MEDIEAQNRGKNVILSGKVLAGVSSENLAEYCVQLLHQKVNYYYNLPAETVLSVYRLGARRIGQSPDKRSLKLKLRHEGITTDILTACCTIKPPDMYANEDWIPSREKILYLLRRAKSRSGDRLTACGSLKGYVYALLKPPNESARTQRILIMAMSRLESLCSQELGISFVELTEGTSTTCLLVLGRTCGQPTRVTIYCTTMCNI